MIGMYNEIHEIGCMNPGNEVFQVLDEQPEAEVGKSGENNEILRRRRIYARQLQEGPITDSFAVDIKVLELGCCGQSSGEDLW